MKPRHVAIIMDGNGRWAKKRLLPRTAGHHAAVKRVRELIETCAKEKIAVLTLFAFSTENWNRPENEVSTLMKLLLQCLETEVKTLHHNGVELKFIGDRSRLSSQMQHSMMQAESLTQGNSGLKLCIALNYGGQWDILQATKAIVKEALNNKIKLDQIDEGFFEQHLSTQGLPPVDLFIRTSGEQRISNFLLWQSAYAELYFTSTPFPAFDTKAFEAALKWYSDRERRFGKTSEQLEGEAC